MPREGKCQFCGRLVIRDDAAQTIGHAEPVCKEFDEWARGGTEAPEVRHVNNEAVPAHLAALRARVKS